MGLMVLLIAVPTPKRRSSRRDTGAIPGLLLNIFCKPELAQLNVGIFILHTVLTALFVAVPLRLVQFGVSESSHWLVYLPIVLLSFCAIVPLIIVSEKKGRSKEVFLFAVLALGLSFYAFTQVDTRAVFMVVLFCFFVAFNLLEAMLPSLISKLAPAGAKGTALGVYSSCQFGGAFVGGSVAGWLLLDFNHSVLFLVCALACLVWALVALFMPRPKKLVSMSLPASDERVLRKLSAEHGVEDAVLIEEESIIYLKFDKEQVSVEHLKQVANAV